MLTTVIFTSGKSWVNVLKMASSLCVLYWALAPKGSRFNQIFKTFWWWDRPTFLRRLHLWCAHGLTTHTRFYVCVCVCVLFKTWALSSVDYHRWLGRNQLFLWGKCNIHSFIFWLHVLRDTCGCDFRSSIHSICEYFFIFIFFIVIVQKRLKSGNCGWWEDNSAIFLIFCNAQ